MDMTTPNETLCRLEDIPDGGVLGVDPPDPEGEHCCWRGVAIR
jgi:hypothetical protein